MRRKTKTYKKLSKVLADLGCELTSDGILYSFGKDHIDYLIDVDEKEETFWLVEMVAGLKGG